MRVVCWLVIKPKTPKPMQTFIPTFCTILLLALYSSAAAQPTPGAVPNYEKEPERGIRNIPLPPTPGETLPTTYCPMKIGEIPLRDKPLKVDYSRKPEAGRVNSGEQVIRDECIPEIVDCRDKKPYSALLASGCLVPPPPPPPPPPQIRCMEIFRIVEEMPRFPGCEELPTAGEKKQCSDRKMLDFLYQNLTYPALARESCVEGTTVIQFAIEKNGSVTDAKVVRDIGAQCGEEALRVVNLMNEQGLKWVPGKQRGQVVRVLFNLPIRFRLDCPCEEPPSTPVVNEKNPEKAEEALAPTEATPSGTPLPFELEGFRLFPNPAVGQLNVSFQSAPGPVALAIVNTSGQVVWKQEYDNPTGSLNEPINLGQWPAGPYLLQIGQQSLMQAHPFIKMQ